MAGAITDHTQCSWLIQVKLGAGGQQYNQDGNPANQITIKEEITISHYNQFLHCLTLIVLYFKINQSFEVSATKFIFISNVRTVTEIQK